MNMMSSVSLLLSLSAFWSCCYGQAVGATTAAPWYRKFTINFQTAVPTKPTVPAIFSNANPNQGLKGTNTSSETYGSALGLCTNLISPPTKNESLPRPAVCMQEFRMTDICPGQLNKNHLRWFYNYRVEKCLPFYGCKPATQGNNFQTIEACGIVCQVNVSSQKTGLEEYGLFYTKYNPLQSFLPNIALPGGDNLGQGAGLNPGSVGQGAGAFPGVQGGQGGLGQGFNGISGGQGSFPGTGGNGAANGVAGSMSRNGGMGGGRSNNNQFTGQGGMPNFPSGGGQMGGYGGGGNKGGIGGMSNGNQYPGQGAMSGGYPGGGNNFQGGNVPMQNGGGSSIDMSRLPNQPDDSLG